MKKRLIVIGLSLFLVGCSNDDKEIAEVKKEEPIAKVDKETKEKAEKYADEFTNGTPGQIKMTFNEDNSSFDVEYLKEDQSKLISDLSDKLDELTTFNALVFLAQKNQENKEVFDLFDDEISVNLVNPNNKELPLYSVKKDKIKYPASEKAFDGKLPNPISKNMTQILEVADFTLKPYAKTRYDQEKNIIIIDVALSDEQINSNGMKDTLKSSVNTIYETVEKVYSEKYDISFVNNGDEVLKLENGNFAVDKL